MSANLNLEWWIFWGIVAGLTAMFLASIGCQAVEQSPRVRSVRGPAHLNISAIRTIYGDLSPTISVDIEEQGWLFFGPESAVGPADLPFNQLPPSAPQVEVTVEQPARADAGSSGVPPPAP